MPESILFQALSDVTALALPSGVPSSGTKFEDYTFQQLYQRLRELGGPKVLLPRHTLRERTLSGMAHQFDIVVQEARWTTIECKFRKSTGIDDLFGFRGKLVDYVDVPRGIFVTTARHMHDELFCYAIAHHISVVCLCLAPVQYMLRRVKPRTDLSSRLASLDAYLQSANKPKQVLIQWQNEYRRFKAEGYC